MKLSRPSLASILIALALLLSGANPSPNPSPGPRNTPQPNKTANLPQGESGQHPTNVNVAGSAYAPDYAGGTAQKNNSSDSISNEILVAATVVMALAALMLAIFNCQLVTVTRAIYKASQTIEEPYLGFGNFRLRQKNQQGLAEVVGAAVGQYLLALFGPVTQITITFTIKNHGKGIAKIEHGGTRLHFSLEIMGGGTPRPENRFKTEVIGFQSRVIAPFDETQEFIFLNIPQAMWARVVAREIRFRLFCLITYKDVFKRPYREQFILIYEPPSWDFDVNVEDDVLITGHSVTSDRLLLPSLNSADVRLMIQVHLEPMVKTEGNIGF
jgi:hypothetical protein